MQWYSVVLIPFLLSASEVHELDSVTVSAEVVPVPVGNSVAVVDTVGRYEIEQSSSPSIIDLLDGRPGVRKKIDCSVCNTAQIRLLGLNGAYSQVLVDGLPLFSGLGTVYGIEQIPLVTVQRIDVLKGASSVRHGNNAIAGVIDVITGSIPMEPMRYLKMNYGHNNEQHYEGAFSQRIPLSGTGIEVAFQYANSPMITMDTAPVSDVAAFDRVGFSSRISQWLGSSTELTGRVNVNYEDRFGGTATANRTTVGSYTPDSSWLNEWGDTVVQPLVYQEYVRSRRVHYEIGLDHDITDRLLSKTRLTYLQHLQESWYGYLDLIAEQNLFYGVSDFELNLESHALAAGMSYTYDGFTDNRSIGTHTYSIPSLYLEDRYSPSLQWDITGGIRLDYHSAHGLIVSPRGSVIYYGMPFFQWKLSGGKGFRTFNLFSENHSAITSEVYYLEPNDSLRAENSYSLSLNGQFSRNFSRNWGLALEGTLFSTAIQEYIQVEYRREYTQDGRQKVSYENSSDRIRSRGAELVGTVTFPRGITVEGGGTVTDFAADNGVAGDYLYFTPRYTGLASFSWESEPWGTHFSVDMNYVGAQRLREIRFGSVVQLPERYSPAYALFSTKFEKRIRGITLAASVENIGNFYQSKEEPIFHAQGWYYQTTSVWGPLKGRTFYLGIRYNAGGFRGLKQDESIPHSH